MRKQAATAFRGRPSRSGEFQPKRLGTLASSGSCHRTKAAASRRELELLLLPVGSLPTAMTCPLRSTSITLASTLLRGSPPLSGASVLSASRLEPLAPCMGLLLSSGFRAAIFLSCFLDRFLCSTWNPVSSSRPAVLQSRRAQELSRLAVAPTFPRALRLPGHTLTAPSTAAHSIRLG